MSAEATLKKVSIGFKKSTDFKSNGVDKKSFLFFNSLDTLIAVFTIDPTLKIIMSSPVRILSQEPSSNNWGS